MTDKQVLETAPIRDANQDDWHSLKDPKERKRIQDRLAQRTRRRKLRESRKKDGDDKTKSTVVTIDQNSPKASESSALQLIPSTSASDKPLLTLPSGQPIYSLDYETPAAITVFGALFINGKILGLNCFDSIAKKSPVAEPHVPLPLWPTTTQLTTLHLTGIDRFPFPRMRDNYIILNGVFDEEEFSMDLFVMPSFTIVPEGAPWDPKAWRIDKGFAEKWGFLFE